MLDILFWIVVFIISVIVLIKGSDYFLDSAERIGLHFKVSPFIIGVSILAIGTSLPELITSIFAVLHNSSEIVIGNVIGSNIANFFLVLGVAAIIGKKLKISHKIINVDLPLLVGSAAFLAITILDGVFTIYEAILAIAFLTIYIFSTIKLEKEDIKVKKEVEKQIKEHKKLGKKVWGILALSALLIYLGARYTIESVINISDMLNIGKEIIAISAVALGTSLPELFVSIKAAKKGKADMAIGNLLGSNIFNTLAVMGIPALIGKLIIPTSMITFGLPIMLLATLIYFFTIQDQEVTRWEGWMLIIFYILFIGKLFNLF